MALTDALCVSRVHFQYTWIAVNLSVLVCVCVCLYVPHDAMSYDATRWSVMPCDTYRATWCSAMRRDDPARCHVMPCISIPCPDMLCNALCDATRCHAMPHSTCHCTLHDAASAMLCDALHRYMYVIVPCRA